MFIKRWLCQKNGRFIYLQKILSLKNMMEDSKTFLKRFLKSKYNIQLLFMDYGTVTILSIETTSLNLKQPRFGMNID